MNPETLLTLDEAVDEVLNSLTGLDLTYSSQYDRYRSITRMLNRALRYNALEHEWSWYADTMAVGTAAFGESQVFLSWTKRPRMVNDDAVRLVDADGNVRAWAYFLPRDAVGKYQGRAGLWCEITRNVLTFSRPFNQVEAGLDIHLPVMREPTMFRLPPTPEDPNAELEVVPAEVRDQPIDFVYPDVIIARAAYLYAQTDPLMQPRVQTLEAAYKDLMYQVIERDDRHTDSPHVNETVLPMQNGLNTPSLPHAHPHANWS